MTKVSAMWQRDWTPYCDAAVDTAVRRLQDDETARPSTESRLTRRCGSITADTLERLCRALNVQPGELLEWIPDKHKGARKQMRRKG